MSYDLINKDNGGFRLMENMMTKKYFLISLAILLSTVLISCNQNAVSPASSAQSRIPSWAIGSWADANNMFKATISSNEVVLTINNTTTYYLMEQMKNAQGKLTITSEYFIIDVYHGDGTSYYKFSIKDSSSIVLSMHSLGNESSIVLFSTDNTNNSISSDNSNSESSAEMTWNSINTSFSYKLVINPDKKTGSVTIPEGTFSGRVIYTSMINDMGGYQVKRYGVVFDFDDTDDFLTIERENTDGTYSDYGSVAEVWDQQIIVLRGSETIRMMRD